jgi:hypothetical protein
LMKWISMAKIATVVASFGSMTFSYVLGPSSPAGPDMGYAVLLTALANATVVTGGHMFGRKKDTSISSEGIISSGTGNLGRVADEMASSISVAGTDAAQQGAS